MIRANVYTDLQYAIRNLSGTVVRKVEDGWPVRVHNIYTRRGVRGYTAQVQPLDKEVLEEVPLRELDIEPVRLGFCKSQVDTFACYLSRAPLRNDWRQGLRSNNIRSLWGPDPRYCDNRSLVDTIMGFYPSYEAAIDLSVNTPERVIPISRDWALKSDERGDVTILYKWMGCVGDVQNNQVRVFDQYNYLSETLQGVVGCD
jgi:hypothetical protein